MPHSAAIAKIRIGHNSLWSAAGYAAGILIMLFTIPTYTKLLGLDQFGIFTLLASVTAPLGVLNAGVAQATTKYIAEFLAAKEHANSTRLFRTTLLFNLLLGLIGGVGLWLSAKWLASHAFNIPPTLIDEAVFAFRITGLVWLLNQIAGTFQAVIIGLQKFRAVAIGQVLHQLATYGGGVVALHITPHLGALVTLNVLVGVAAVVGWYFVTRRNFAEGSLWPRWDVASAKTSLNFSLWQALNSFVMMIANHADRLLLGALANTATVGVFGVAQNVQARTTGLIWSFLGTLFPAASSLSRTEGASEQFILEKGWAISLGAGVLYGSLFIVGPDLLVLWVGPELGHNAGPVLMILLAVALAGLPSAVVYQYLLGMGLTRIVWLGSAVTSLVSVLTSVLLISRFGLPGAAWGALAGLLLTRPVFHWWIFHRYFPRVFTPAKCFGLLYGVVLSSSLATSAGVAMHYIVRKAFGPLIGLFFSCLIVPAIVASFILLAEVSVLRRAHLMKNLLRQIRKWSSLDGKPSVSTAITESAVRRQA